MSGPPSAKTRPVIARAPVYRMAAYSTQPIKITKPQARRESARTILRRAGVDRCALKPLQAVALPLGYEDEVVV